MSSTLAYQLDKWDDRFVSLANTVATWSKDPSKKVGAVLTKDRVIYGTGFNGFPSRIEDSLERYLDREIKLRLTVHAELNAILNAAKNGSKTQGCTLYSTFFPCVNCATAIIQSGVIRVVAPSYDTVSEVWKESMATSEELFLEAGLNLVKYCT